jgi:hypothetical protein
MQSSLAVAGLRDTDPAETLHVEAAREHKPLIQFGLWADWHVEPTWNLRNAARLVQWRQIKSVEAFLRSDDKVLVHATFRFAVDQFGVEAFDHRLIAVDKFHHVSANPDNKLGVHLGQFIARGRVHVVAMTGSHFRGDAAAVLAPQDRSPTMSAIRKPPPSLFGACPSNWIFLDEEQVS